MDQDPQNTDLPAQPEMAGPSADSSSDVIASEARQSQPTALRADLSSEASAKEEPTPADTPTDLSAVSSADVTETSAPPEEPQPPVIPEPRHSELGEESNNPVIASVARQSQMTELLARAQAKIQSNKQKKLEKLLQFAGTKDKIANEDVQKLLRVSNATATRYLEQLVKEGKLMSSGTRKGASYQLVRS